MATVDEELAQLEKDIRQLKIEYEAYFGGGRKRPPTEITWRIEQLIKRYAERQAQINFNQRFKYNNLAQTYAKYQDVFRKRMKKKEEGVVERHFGAAAREIEAERERARAASAPPPTQEAERETPAVAAAARRAAQEAGYAMACSDPDREPDKVKQLYQALVEAKQKAGEKTDSLTLDNFQQFVRNKTQQLRQQKGCEQVEYVVAVEGGQVKLKARVKN